MNSSCNRNTVYSRWGAACLSGSLCLAFKSRVGLLPSSLLAVTLSLGGVLAVPAPRALALDPLRSLTQYQRRSWGPENGLPCSNVNSVTQASDGYLWLGTEEGVVRFDGVRSQVFDRKNDAEIGSNVVYSVREDPRRPGEPILGTAGGFGRLVAGKMQAFPSAASPANQSGTIIFQDPVDGASWVRTTHGLIRVSPDGGVTGPFEGTPGWPAEKIRAVCRDGAGHLRLGTVQGLYQQHEDGNDEAGRRFDLLPGWEGKKVDCLIPARSGGLWVASRDAGIGRLAPDGTFHAYPALTGRLAKAMLEDRAGTLWVGTYDAGLFRLPASDDPGTGSPPMALTTENGLIHNAVNDLCEDREGNLWIATQGGLQVLGDTRFVNYGPPEGLAGEDVRSIFEDARGRIWMGDENGLGMLAPGEDRVVNYPLAPSPRRPGNNRVLTIARGDDDDTLLVGTNAGLVRWRDGKVELLPLREDLDRSAVTAFCRDAAGDLWVGTDSGVYQVRNGEVLTHLAADPGLASNTVYALHADRHGNLWVGTHGGLTRRWPDGRITTVQNSGSGRLEGAALSLFEDATGTGDLFVGTYSGLYRLRVADDGGVRITRYTEREGLFNNTAWGMLADARGSLWMSSNKGVSRVALADFARFDRREIPLIPHVAYGVADGMRSREGNGGYQPVACRDRLGRLWFATIKGATMVDPTRVSVNPVPPPVQVEEFLADGKVPPAEATKAPRGGENKPLLKLVPGTQKLDFRYTALSLVNPEANHFRSWLEGFDAGWTEAGTERAAHYTNLPPGNYRFHVQAANADGVWNTQGATLAFRLQPFFYQTGWFRALIVGAALVLLSVLQHGLRRSWQRRLADSEAKLRERERTAEILRRSKEQAEQAHAVAEQARQEAEAAQREAEGARTEAERANAAKSHFLSRMSHELRTPLNAILGFGQVLEFSALAEQDAVALSYILKGGRHLLALIDEVLDLSRAESGELRLALAGVDATVVVEECIQLVARLAEARQITLTLKNPGASGNLWCDELRLRQVLLNLLSNAIKYNREGGEVLIDFEAVPANRARLNVRDTGPGISAEGLTHLFVPFERLEYESSVVEGTGLGLVVSRGIAEAMNGTMGVQSEPGRGSTFWIELPRVETQPSLLEEAALSIDPLPQPGGASSAVTLLYIEDNLSNIQVVRMLFSRLRPHWRLLSAQDGVTGLDMARRETPNVILLDLQMPGMPGADVMEELRADPLTRKIPVLVLSADATGHSRKHLLGRGADAYIVKPFQASNLLDVLDDTLDKVALN